MKTTWNYRVIKKNCPRDGTVSYQIHEVYYQPDGSIDCWNDVPVEPIGMTESGLRNDIQSFLAAFRLPVLVEHYINGKAKLLAEHAAPSRAYDLQADYISKTSRASGYLDQILGNHLLLKQHPPVREAYEKVDRALADLHALVNGEPVVGA